MSLINLQTKIGAKADGVFGPNTLRKAMEFYKLTPITAAHFFGQVGHETGNFKLFTENLNYSASGLRKTFKKYFPGKLAELYARNPEKIGSRVYANRMGNGDEESKEGFFFRGRGALQLTGKLNYIAFSKYLEKPCIVFEPDWVTTEYAFESAMFFFKKNKLWSICSKDVSDKSITALSRRINGGINGLEDRIEKTNKYYEWLTKK